MTTDTLCACGCNKPIIVPINKWGYKRSFLDGHGNNQKIGKYIFPQFKICNYCKLNLPIEKFRLRKYVSKINNKSADRPASRCRDCEKQNRKDYVKNNPEKIKATGERYHEKHLGTIKYHVQERIAGWHKASVIPSDLTVDYLVDLYNKQDGYCYYSGEKMIFGWIDGKINHNTMSLDKLDPSKGYVQGNVVWCSYLVNTMKQDLTENEFYEMLSKILERTKQ
jgi:hypothetical protein